MIARFGRMMPLVDSCHPMILQWSWRNFAPVGMGNGKMRIRLVVEFCGESQSNWPQTSTNGPKQINTSTIFVLFMNYTAVSVISSCSTVRTSFEKETIGPLIFASFGCWIGTILLGEDVNGMSFQGADEELLRRALSILEDQGKCAIFKGETSEEDGIKFFGWLMPYR